MAVVKGAAYVAALGVVRRLKEMGHAAYFAGGCVRDLLLGVEAKDFDVATSATPEVVQAAFARTEAVGAHFGVVLVVEGDVGQLRSSDRENAEEAIAWTTDSPQRLKPQDTGGLDGTAEAVPLAKRDLPAATEALTLAKRDLPAATEALTLQGERVVTEVATFRHDGAYRDGRRPDAVRFSVDPREDVLRRDFTVNGLLLDVVAYEEGDRLEDCVLDYVGGRADLRAGVVRAIGEPEVRFAEDKLRMLRAVRFAARLGFAIERRTMEAMRAQAAEVGVVSAERVREELTKILTEGGARRGFELLDASGLLVQVLPEVARMKGVEQPPQYHPEGDVWVHTLLLLGHLEAGASATLAWGMLLHDVGKPATFTPPDAGKAGDRIRFNGHVDVGVALARKILTRLRFSNEDCEQILALVKHHMQFGDVMEMKQSTLKRFLRMPRFEEHLALHRADCLSSHGKLEMYAFAKEQMEAMGEEEIRPRMLVNGGDFIAAGYRPGPQFRVMLEAVEDAQLEGVVGTREEAMLWVRERFGEAVR